jgi:DNA-binding XRE family transcriptional regulator
LFGFAESDEVYDDVASTADRLVEILRDGQHTDPKELLLNELRDRLGMSQEELAKALDVRQPTLSKMERRRDLLISSLRKIVEGLGGKLEIAARFPKALVQLVQFTGPERGKSRSASKPRSPRRAIRRKLKSER